MITRRPSTSTWDAFEVCGFLENVGLKYLGLVRGRFLCKKIRKLARRAGILENYDKTLQVFVRQSYDQIGSQRHRQFMEARANFETASRRLRKAAKRSARITR